MPNQKHAPQFEAIVHREVRDIQSDQDRLRTIRAERNGELDKLNQKGRLDIPDMEKKEDIQTHLREIDMVLNDLAGEIEQLEMRDDLRDDPYEYAWVKDVAESERALKEIQQQRLAQEAGFTGVNAVIEHRLQQVFDKAERSERLLQKYIDREKGEHEAADYRNYAAMLIGLAGFAAGVTGLVLAMRPPVTGPAPSAGKYVSAADGRSAVRHSARTSNSADLPLEPLSSNEEDERTIQDLLLYRSLAASGCVSTPVIWARLARGAADRDLDAHGFTLSFLLSASAPWKETHLFSWDNETDRREASMELYQAYRTNGRLDDLFVAAAALKRDDKPVPLFHVATAAQAALGLIAHHQMFPETDLLATG